MAFLTLVKCAAYGLMNINELDLITIKVDIDMGLLQNAFMSVYICVYMHTCVVILPHNPSQTPTIQWSLKSLQIY